MGLSHQRAARVLELGYGLKWSRSRVGRAWERLGNLAAPACQRLPSRLPQSPVVWLDDTGWRVGAQPQNLRVLLSEQVTVYLIEPHRGYAEAAAILGEDYAGFLVPDGARCFYGLEQALHPSCLEHLIRRCREMTRMASAAAARFPLAVRRLLQQGLDLRDRYRQGSLSGHGLAVATGRQRLAKHLRRQPPHLFTFLRCPGWEAANHVAERIVRPASCAPAGSRAKMPSGSWSICCVPLIPSCWRSLRPHSRPELPHQSLAPDPL